MLSDEGDESVDDSLQLVGTDDGVLGTGTYGEVRLSICQGRRVAVKTYSHGNYSTAPLVQHPGLVRVIMRGAENGCTVEIRKLCRVSFLTLWPRKVAWPNRPTWPQLNSSCGIGTAGSNSLISACKRARSFEPLALTTAAGASTESSPRILFRKPPA